MIERKIFFRRWRWFKSKPGFAQGSTDGEVDGGDGLFGAGAADEEVEAGAGEETFEDPFECGRLVEGFAGLIKDAIGEGTVDSVRAEGIHLSLDAVAIWKAGDGIVEGAEAGGTPLRADVVDEDGDLMPGRGEDGEGIADEAEFDEVGEDLGGIGIGSVGNVGLGVGWWQGFPIKIK